MYGSIADGSGGGTFGCLGGLVRMQVRGVGQNNEIAFQAKVAGANVTGGSYRWDAQKFKMVYVQGSNEVASVSRFPENGVIYLTVAVDQEVNETGAAPQTEITARLYTGAGDADGT